MQRLRRLALVVSGWPDLPLAAAIVLTLAAIIEARYASPSDVDATTAVVIAFLATAPHALGDRYLTLAAVIVCGATGAWLAMSSTALLTILIGQWWIVYRVAAAHPRKWAALALLVLIGNAVYPYSGGNASQAAILLAFGIAVAILGDARRQGREAIAERDVARDETAEARHDQAVLAERWRIARELHDVVAHHVSTMVVQAETARVGTPGLVPEGERSLESIRDTGRQALAELRRVLSALRSDSVGSRAPQPGLDGVDDLVETVRTAGIRIQLRREGDERVVPAGVELCAYRIIQEALTNVRRHAPGAGVTIGIRYEADVLRLSIRDDGPGSAPAATDGYGLIGMRERAALAGGTLTAGPMPGGGFEVVADLPLEGGRS